MLRVLRTLGRDNRGATAVEYGLILALIVLAMLGALSEMAASSGSMWRNIGNKSAAAMLQ